MVQLTYENAVFVKQILKNTKYMIETTPYLTKYVTDSLVILVKNNNNIIVIDKRGEIETVYKDLKIAAIALA